MAVGCELQKIVLQKAHALLNFDTSSYAAKGTEALFLVHRYFGYGTRVLQYLDDDSTDICHRCEPGCTSRRPKWFETAKICDYRSFPVRSTQRSRRFRQGLSLLFVLQALDGGRRFGHGFPQFAFTQEFTNVFVRVPYYNHSIRYPKNPITQEFFSLIAGPSGQGPRAQIPRHREPGILQS